MNGGQIVNGVHLHQSEDALREYVRQHPDDMKTRLELAWCLLVKAFYQAGRESLNLTNQSHDTDADTSWFTEAVTECDSFVAAKRDMSVAVVQEAAFPDVDSCRSNDLFCECLHQALTVQQLSPCAEDHISAKHLQSLVCLSGRESAVVVSQHRLLTRALSMFRDLTEQAQTPD